MIKKQFILFLLLFTYFNNSFAQTNNDTAYFLYTAKHNSKIELKYHYVSKDTLVQVVRLIVGNHTLSLNFDTLVVKGFNVYRINYNKLYKYLIYEDFINNTSNLYKEEYNGTVSFEKVVPLSLISENKNMFYKYTLDYLDALVDLNCVMKYTFSIKDKRIIQIDNFY